MTLLTLDLASNFGWCKGDIDRRPSSDSIKLPKTGDDVGSFLIAYKKEINELLKCVTKVCFEAPLLPKATSVQTVRKLHGLASITEMQCVEKDIPCFQVQPMAVKKNFLGNASIPKGATSKEKKAPMIKTAKDYGFNPNDSDEADAIAIWFYVMTKASGVEACQSIVNNWR